MIKWLKEKINNVTDSIAYTMIEKRFNKASKEVSKNKKFNEASDEEKNEFIGSRSCYRQYFRLFGQGNNSVATIQYSEESKIVARDILKADFDITKLSRNLSVVINECTKMCTILQQKDPALSKNTVVDIYLRAVKVLTDKKLLSFIRKHNSQIPAEYMHNISKSNVTINEKKIIYQSCYLVLAYTNLIFLVLHMTCAFAMAASLITCYGGNPTADEMQKFFINRFRYLFFKGIINSIDLIVYFENFDYNKAKAFLDKPLNETKTYESYDNGLKYIYTAESATAVAASVVASGGALPLVTVIAIGIGVALGLMLLLPLIRGLIYYWGSLKIDLSNFFKDESIFFSYNASALENSLNEAKNEKDRIRIENAIKKQKALAEKFDKLSYRFSIEYEKAIHDAEAVADADEKYEEQEIREEEIPNSFM